VAGTTMLDELEVSDAQAKKIIKIAIEQNAYDSDMPTSKKERLEAAHEIVAFCIDAWKNDGARPDDEDEEIAEGANAILQIFEIAGIEADEDGTIEFAGAEDEDEEDDEETEEDDDEGPFDPDDYIEGYTELTATTKIKKIKELDPDDEDFEPLLTALAEWEEDQEKPASRVLDFIAEALPEEDEDDEDEEENDEDEEPVDEEDDDDEEDESEEPWEGYDDATAVDVKKVLNEAFENETLTAEQLEYVSEYENARAQPRKRILKLVDELVEGLGNGEEDDEEDEDEVEVKPVSKRGKLKTKASVDGITITYIVGDDTFEVDGVTALSFEVS